MGLLDEDFDWSNDAHKIIVGAASFFAARWLYDSFSNGQINLPSSDETIYSKTINLPQHGNASVYRTLEEMAKMVRRDRYSNYLRSIALTLVRGCAGHDDECELRRVFEFAKNKITYRRDPAGIERISDARRTIESGVGDCDDKVIVLCSISAVLGYASRFVVCGFEPRNFSHVYCEVFSRRGWVALDPTPENATYGWEQTHAPYKEKYEIFK